MEENEEKRVCPKRPCFKNEEVDRLSNLTDCLLLEILSNLPTKDAVKCSALSSRWRNLWKHVSWLDLQCRDFIVPIDDDDDDGCDCDDEICSCEDLGFNAFVGFVDKFLGFNTDSSCIQKFKLNVNWYDDVQLDVTHFTRWINTVVDRKVKHLHVLDKTLGRDEVEIPSTIYTCESLVSLKLRDVYLPNPDLVSLPCVKVLVLDGIMFEYEDDKAFEMMILGCPVLESLTISLDSDNIVKTFRVCSQSLLRFTHAANNVNRLVEDIAVVIDAPKLECLKISDHQTANFVINNPGSLVEVDIDIIFNLRSEKQLNANDLPKRNMIRDFLVGISCVKDMKISSSTLQAIYDYSRYEPLPLFPNLSLLHVEFSDYRWEVLPIFLESCPNLKSLTLGFKPPRKQGVSILPGPRKFLTSLEHVKIVKPMAEEAIETKLKLVSYFLENSTILKKLTLCLGNFRPIEESVLVKKLLTIPRVSSSCGVHVLSSF